MSGLFVENSCEILRTYFSNLGISFPGGKGRKRETGRKKAEGLPKNELF